MKYFERKSFSKKLAKLRNTSRLTQDQLAKELHISRSCLSNYESGKRLPDIEMLKSISDYFKVSSEYLLQNDSSIESDITPERLARVRCKDSLDIKNINPLSKLELINFYNFLVQREELTTENS